MPFLYNFVHGDEGLEGLYFISKDRLDTEPTPERDR